MSRTRWCLPAGAALFGAVVDGILFTLTLYVHNFAAEHYIDAWRALTEPTG